MKLTKKTCVKERTRRSLSDRAGFTLIELVICIGIVAILAGIGTVAYTGYIKKANEAADYLLLREVNASFAAACVENGDDIHNITSAALITSAGKVAGVSLYNDSFLKYYKDNADTAFQSISVTQIAFDAQQHAFVAEGAEQITLSLGSGTITVSTADLAALKTSTFITGENLGVENLLAAVDNTTAVALAMDNSDILKNFLNSAEFLSYAAEATGIDATDPDYYSQLEAALGTMISERMAVHTDESAGEAQSAILANAAVMYAAECAQSMSTEDIVTLLSSKTTYSTIVDNLKSNAGEALTQAGLAYGMYLAYIESTGQAGTTNTDLGSVLGSGGFDSSDFNAYIKSDQGQTDLAGYLAALSAITDSTNDTDAVTYIMVNGYNSEDLVNQLTYLLGS